LTRLLSAAVSNAPAMPLDSSRSAFTTSGTRPEGIFAKLLREPLDGVARPTADVVLVGYVLEHPPREAAAVAAQDTALTWIFSPCLISALAATRAS
jgi:hypothetical protein